MSKSVNTKEFIKRSRKIHGNKYDYTESNYENCDIKITIICPKHGKFKQLPRSHMNHGNGCKKCSYENKKTNISKFFEKAKKLHNEKYQYYNDYYDNKIRIKIKCPIHGVFKQTPGNHLSGHGCKKCSISAVTHNKKIFIDKARKIHGNKYDYSLSKYINSKTEVEIICPEHGIFRQKPENHYLGRGCKNCCKTGIKLSNEKFIEKAKNVHGNRYDYSLVRYKTSHEKVTIVCFIHGVFQQRPNDHLNKRGCYKCRAQTSKKQKILFNSLKNEIDTKILLEQKILLKNNKTCIIDILLPNKKIAIEYNGDYWHCNPKLYKSDYFHTRKKMYAKEIWEYDESRKQELEKLGYKLLTVWENDFKNNQNKTLKNILTQLKK